MLDRTDSYCERCGTRYAFRANAPRMLSLKGARVLAKGLKNFVLTDGQSMNDSLALARHDDEHEDTTRMTEAFHRTFNFCMTCRQYACDKCWNAHQGACLTCAPERESGPVAPEDHLIIRTPVARSDSDWELFPDILGDKGEPAGDMPPPVQAWPAQDLQAMASAAGAGAAKKGHDQPVRTSEDQEAWSVWPIADEIAPEMTLTPGEMVLVEAQLAHDEPIEDAPVVVETVSSQALPAASEIEVWALPGDLAGISAEAGEPSSPAAVDGFGLAGGLEATPPEQQAVPVADTEIAPLPLPTVPPPVPAAPREQRPAVARLLGRLSPRRDADSSLRGREHESHGGEPAGDPWPHATAWSERPISVHDWSADANPVTTGPVAEVVAEPETAPIGTTYSETPAEPQPVELETGAEAEPAELSVEPARAPESFADEPRGADFSELLGRIAAPPAAPMSAQEPVTVAANQQTLFDAAPATDDLAAEPAVAAEAAEPAEPAEPGPEPVAWPEVFGEVAAAPHKPAPPDATPIAPPFAASTPPSRGPQAPAPWPPLGASWPAHETPGAPWPGPDAPSVPALVAAREAAIPVLAEMWAQSAQQVLNRGTVRVCHHCALPVSTQARFCRRCGTKQA
jgi:hypothetical protein